MDGEKNIRMQTREAFGALPEGRMQAFEEISGEVQGDDVIQAGNIISGRDICIRTADMEIRVKKDRPDLVESRMIDGRPCFVIGTDSTMELNGMPVQLFSGRSKPWMSGKKG